MRALAALVLLALTFAAAAVADDVPTVPTETATTTAATTTAPTTTSAPTTTTSALTTTAPTTTSAPTTTTVATTTSARTTTTTPTPRISLPAVSGTYELPAVVPVPAHVEGPLRTIGKPLQVTPALNAGPYVFPVAGDVSWGDSYGGARSDVPGGWHHGDDLFAKLGQPVLAVAAGHVYKVGWERLGGWRVWLKDREGNRFYYAHLSGYSPLAQDRAEVNAGDVIGYIGHTGDAYTTPFHLHFEIHPVSLLWMHYNGAVDPTSYLSAWRRISTKSLPRPAPLPSGAAAHGEGALSDYRRLLSLFAVPATPKSTAAAAALPNHAEAAGQVVAASAGKPATGRSLEDALAIAAILVVASLALLRRRLATRTSGSQPPRSPSSDDR